MPDLDVGAATLRFIDQQRGSLLLHAGMVAADGHGCVIHGPSGAGKTTLTIALATRGTSYVTDETVCLDPATLRVIPFPKPLTIKRGSQDLLAKFKPAPERIDSTSGSWHIDPADLVADDAKPLSSNEIQPSLLVFPDITPDSTDVEVQAVSPARAAFLLGEQSSALWAIEPRPLAALERLVRAAPAYRVSYSNAFDAADVILRDLLPTATPSSATAPSDDPQPAPSDTAYPARASNMDWIELDGEAVLFDGKQLHHLDAPACAIWTRLDGTRSLPDIAAELAQVFGADPLHVELDVEDLVRVMTASGVVRISES